ncbi:MAG TPA: hypothetical protein PK090_05300 [Smithellaceae bacterium]|nr:hypothetical protein [Smithellaceae bacterium]
MNDALDIHISACNLIVLLRRGQQGAGRNSFDKMTVLSYTGIGWKTPEISPPDRPMAAIEWEKVCNIAMMRRIHHQNKMDLTFALEMLRIVDELLADPSIKSMILTSGEAEFFPWVLTWIGSWKTRFVSPGFFNKGRNIFGELKRRMNQQIISVMETEDGPLLESLSLFTKEQKIIRTAQAFPLSR